jgi:subtilisin family serine protease
MMMVEGAVRTGATLQPSAVRRGARMKKTRRIATKRKAPRRRLETRRLKVRSPKPRNLPTAKRPDRDESEIERRRLHPKLQMFRNCAPEINQVRAELSASLFVPNPDDEIPEMRGPDAMPLMDYTDAPRAKTLRKPDNRSYVNVFVDLDRKDMPPLPGEKYRTGTLALAEVAVAQLDALSTLDGVTMVNPAERLIFSEPAVGGSVESAPKARGLALSRDVAKPSPVLVGIIDVQGFDFTHPDFLIESKKRVRSRFFRIWDQGGTLRTPPKYKSETTGDLKFNYGSEITQSHIENAIKQERVARKAGKSFIPARDVEPQSQMAPGSHGTHVASIAAGNSGICPDARIAGVLISLPEEDLDRRKSFYDSSRIVDAVEYLMAVAKDLTAELKLDHPIPVSINISLGTNGDAHDGTSPTCRWIGNVLALPGRCVSVAAGNAGQEAGTGPDDIGYVLGRIHTSGRIASRGLETRLEWQVAGNRFVDLSENELELWYSPQDRFTISLLPPAGKKWIGPIDVREYVENLQLSDGTFVSIYNEAYHPINGCNYISVYLTPNLTPGAVVGVTAGTWTVRLEGKEVRDGHFHGWIERDDPFKLGRIGPYDGWRFPSFFSEKTNVDASQISSLACAPSIVSVANLDESANRIHISSSQGPTRDGRFKPDVAAPGTSVVAAKGFVDGPELWIAMTGTSMSSPFVAGVAAAMLRAAPSLTAAQIGGIMQRTARPLPGKSYDWVNDAGFGVIDPPACLKEAAALSRRLDVTNTFKNSGF